MMSTPSHEQPLSAPRAALLVALFTSAIFLNAGLLFAVEPMFTKMVLPLLGGSPAVWNTCLMFFQAALLVGYLYAHLSSRWLTPGIQGTLHLTLLAIALFTLPLGIAREWTSPPGDAMPVLWLVGLLAASLGLPFVLLSAGAPMMQRWFAATRHPSAHNPYFLYAASNLGSFVALLAYPLIIESRLRLSEQTISWLEFYYVLLILVAACAYLAWRWRGSALALDSPSVAEEVGEENGEEAFPAVVPSRRSRLRWVLLAFAPSSLLLGVSSYIGTDIASIPFLWAIPLALYLLTFVLVFARRQIFARDLMSAAQLVLGLALLVAICLGGTKRMTTQAALHLIAFFVTAMVCHRQLADHRPASRHLTEFYLWISLGGLLGGVFNVLLAPQLYDTVREYPYALIIAFGLRPAYAKVTADRRALVLDLAISMGIFAVMLAVLRGPKPPYEFGTYGMLIFLSLMALAVAASWRRPLRVALSAFALYGAYMASSSSDDVLALERSFFGVYRVRQMGEYHVLQHGTTTHGGQSTQVGRVREPLTYYHANGPLGQALSRVVADRPLRRVAVVGLGTGTAACHGRAGEEWTFFEIDPLVVRIAQDPRLFTYLRDCAPQTDIVLGDARLSLATFPDATFDVVLLDAFSSDAIPVHLMTREALALYLRKLRPGGVVAFHLSNRYLDLRPVVVELARDARLAGALGETNATTADREKLWYGSRWVVLARSARDLNALTQQPNWQVLAPSALVRVWTDDYSDVLGVLRWK